MHIVIGPIQRTLPVFFFVVAVLFEGACMRDSYWVKLSGPSTIGSEWIEFRPETPLKADKDIQWVLLDLEPPFKENSALDPGTKGGILVPDGEVINPEIQVVDEHGNAFELIWSGTRSTPD